MTLFEKIDETDWCDRGNDARREIETQFFLNLLRSTSDDNHTLYPTNVVNGLTEERSDNVQTSNTLPIAISAVEKDEERKKVPSKKKILLEAFLTAFLLFGLISQMNFILSIIIDGILS